MSCTFKTKGERVNDLLGRRIKCRKDGPCKDLTGTIVDTRADNIMPGGYRVDVEYDNGEKYSYSINAVQGFAKKLMFEDVVGYLCLIDDHELFCGPSTPIFFVIDQHGQVRGSGNDYDYLCNKAEAIARQNPASLKLYVCRAMTLIQKSRYQ